MNPTNLIIFLFCKIKAGNLLLRQNNYNTKEFNIKLIFVPIISIELLS